MVFTNHMTMITVLPQCLELDYNISSTIEYYSLVLLDNNSIVSPLHILQQNICSLACSNVGVIHIQLVNRSLFFSFYLYAHVHKNLSSSQS